MEYSIRFFTNTTLHFVHYLADNKSNEISELQR